MPRLAYRIGRLFALILAFAVVVRAQDSASEPAKEPSDAKTKAKNKAKKRADRGDAKSNAEAAGKFDADHPRPARTIKGRMYMGRPIADVMSFEGGGADWLVRPERLQEEHPDEMLDALKIAEGSTVADVGAGVGYITVRIARRVGAKGVVYATDLQKNMLDSLQVNAKNFGLTNIKTILSSPTDPKLPKAKVDLILMTDVYHEFAQPELMIAGLRDALKPGGRIVFVEFRGEDDAVPIKPEHKMTLRQVRKEIEPMGFAFVDSLEFLPWQHIIIFKKPETADSKNPTGSGSEKQADRKSAGAAGSNRKAADPD
jgi:ubiquinone/menaquinone biosynthesis C-methylase UbiE